MLMAGVDQQLINNVLTLSHSVVPHSLKLPSLISEALETSLSQLRYQWLVYTSGWWQFALLYHLISNDKFANKKILLAIGNILKSCQEGWVTLILYNMPHSYSSYSLETTSMETVLTILSDYYKSCEYSADARIAVLELIEQVGVAYCAR